MKFRNTLPEGPVQEQWNHLDSTLKPLTDKFIPTKIQEVKSTSLGLLGKSLPQYTREIEPSKNGNRPNQMKNI